MQIKEMYANMPLTLEQHFEHLAEQINEVQELHSLWCLLRKDLEDRLPLSRGVFVHYSLHDTTHSRSVLHAIERFLGDDRIAQLSATDTFMLLCCAYAHDYGMSMTFNQIYDALGDPDFENFLEEQNKNDYILGKEELQAVRNLLSYIRGEYKSSTSLQELYFAITTVIQMYLRPMHWKKVNLVWEDFKGLFGGRLSMRFIQGGEGIIDICEAHGKPFDAVMKMRTRADGIVGDNFHPRFVAAMLRLGDLLDLDNGRFPRWFVDEIARNRNLIPQLSKLHYQKHESVSHLLITPKRIEVCASCNGENCYDVADLVSEWIEWLTKECTDQILHWSEITQPDFGRPPTLTKREIWVDGKPYISDNRKLQMRMSQDRVMKLLEGTSIYQDQYVGIRELLQNAVDASLLQLWDDIKHNRYVHLKVSKHGHRVVDDIECGDSKKEMAMLEHNQNVISEIFKNYDITVELILDRVDQKVYVVVKDKGLGITPEDAKYISDIGSSKEKNKRTLEITKDMPRWLKPSGVFGIGLQSVFQLTDRIEFYTRRPNEPERLIVFHSYGRNHGKIEIREVTPDTEGIYNDNAVPGTNVKIAIDPEKLLSNAHSMSSEVIDRFLYYDTEFDADDILKMIFVELSHVINEKLKESPCDYFRVTFQTMEHHCADKPPTKEKPQHLRCSFFAPFSDQEAKDNSKSQKKEHTILPFFHKKDDFANPFAFTTNMAFFIDQNLCRIHRLELRPCTIHIKNAEKVLELPQPIRDLYHLQYKFNLISDVETIYPPSIRRLRDVHAGFFNWYINIMDDSPTKYLNIDRDRLREGAILEEELSEVRNQILKNWCAYLIKQYQIKENNRITREKQAKAKHTKEGTLDQFKPEKPTNLFDNTPQTLVSLALLFYQNVSPEEFQTFISPYKDFIEEQNLKLQNETFTVEQLWQPNIKFYSKQTISSQWSTVSVSYTNNQHTSDQLLHLETVLRLPHRLVHIYEISRADIDNLGYYIKLGPPSTTPSAIAMDDSARLLDYVGALDTAFFSKKEVDTAALVRRIFKPNRQFSHLIVNKYPKNFKRDRNFSSPLDHCIRWYILSPFDRDMSKWLKNAVINDSRDTKIIINECRKQVNEYTEKSEHFKKCVRYVLMQQQAIQKSLPANIEDQIKNEYIALLMDCCSILIGQRDLIKKIINASKLE